MDPTPETSDTKQSNSLFWKELLKLVFISLAIVIPFRLFIAQPFIVDGASMDPTFHTGDYLIVDELSYRFKTPERGSVLIFKYPRDPSKSFIKRVIGLPGETISLVNGKVSIINKEHPEGMPLNLNESFVKFVKQETANFVLGDDEYFVMGDNRAGSADSRAWGPVPASNIVGRPILRFLPPAITPGDHTEDITNNNEN